MKKTIYILSKGNVLRKVGRRLRLENQGKRLWEIPCKEVARILIYSSTEVTSQTINGLFDENIPLYYTKRSGAIKGRIIPATDHRIHWRILQYQKFTNMQLSLPIAIQSIHNKIQNMKQIIIHINRNAKNTKKLCEPLHNCIKRLRTCSSSEEIMGVEGIATKHYFEIYGQSFPNDFLFTHRSRPATDYTNALLNLGYMMLFREIISHLEAHGLDPYLGYLHAPQDGRASLALDILEEFRQPFVDFFILKLIRKQTISKKHFLDDDKGIQLNDEGLSVFFKQYEENLGTQDGEEPGKRKMIDQQIVLLKKYLRDDIKYIPFQLCL